jgi:integrase
MASIIWRPKQRKWYAYFYRMGKHVGKPLPPSVPRKPDLTRAERKIAELEAMKLESEAEAVPVSAIDLESAAAYWLDDCRIGLSARTHIAYKSRIKMLLRFLQTYMRAERIPLRSIAGHHIRAFRDHRLQAHSRNTSRNDLKAVSAFFAWAHRQDWIPANPCETVIAPKREHIEAAIATTPEVVRLLDLLQGHEADFQALGILGALCGMRRGEILALRWQDVNLPDRFLRVTLSKSKRPRTVPMSDRVYQFFMDLPQPDPATGPVFPPRRRKGQNRSIHCAVLFNEFLTAQGFPFTHKALRHWCNDQLRRMGLESIARQHVIGHSTEAVNRVYCHPQAEEARPYMDRLADHANLRRDV